MPDTLSRVFRGHPSSSVKTVDVRVLRDTGEFEIVVHCTDGRVLDAERFRLDAKDLSERLDVAFAKADDTKIEISLNAFLIDSISEWLRDEGFRR